MLEMAMRSETDPLGIVQVPRDSLYGAQSERARGNFPTSGTALAALPELIICLAQVKEAAARANLAAGELEAEQAEAIVSACRQLIAGDHHEAFVVDVCQGGAGTSTNMNANEVIANLALRQLGFEPGRYEVISPNDHVNRSQSTNDAYSTAVRLTVHRLNLSLVAALDRLSAAMRGKAEAFAAIPKLGRTQLQDAVPMTLGEEFGAYAATIAEDAARANEMGALFLEVNLGGTAIGTGLGSSQAYRDAVGPALAGREDADQCPPQDGEVAAEGIELALPNETISLGRGSGATLVQSGGAIDPQTRTLPVIFAWNGRQVRPGQRLQGQLMVGGSQQALTIPATALLNEGGQDVVYVQIAGETFQRRPVTVPRRSGNRVAAAGPLKAGERVVSRGAAAVRAAAATPGAFGHGHAH